MADQKRQTSGAPTTDMLRKSIDSAETGDKIDYPDPAAAPLGTDEEVAGVDSGATQRATAYRNEVSRPSASEPRQWWIILGVPTVLVALLVALVVFVMA
ncbi:hypothetical protein [Henriciella sp.]|uniref:hypothetical protein n=1 Tax=Henriciella sp. TaxID=1968823 RepID=UPI002637D13B|nr:hypothetical protein [Henriciella sp.]